MKKYHLLTLLFSCLCLLAWADRVDQRVAQEIAQTVAKSYRHGSLRTSTQPPKLVYAAAAGAEGTDLRSGTAPDQADYYVFNIGTEDGFVIVAGEDRVLPVLGYAEKGTFDPDHLPENLRGMLAYYQQEIDLAVRRNLTATEAVQAAWSRLTSGLGLRTGSSSETVLLETAQWGQSKPYNNQTPTISGKHALTGCVATSLGILLQYCQYPSQLTGGIDSYYEIPISYGTYDWSKMPKSGPTTTDEIEQVSSLLWHIGANVDMEYGLEVSSAYDIDALNFLQNQAQFNQGSRYIERENYYWSEWKEMIRTTLRGKSGQGYPLIYSGSGSDGGHMFLIDGFGPDEYFHINWGWEGYCDGNYVLTALNTDVGSFSEDMGMIHNAVPNTVANEDVIELRYQSLTFGTTFSTTDPFSVKFRAENTGSYTSDYHVGIGLFDENGTLKKTIHTADQICRMPANSYYVFTVPCLINESLSATDQIAPVYKAHSDDTEWKRMPNAPTAARYITSTGDLFTDTDNDNDPALAPIVLTRNDLPDAYFNISALTDDLYNEPKEIELNLAGHSGTKILKFQLQGYDAWQGHLRAWYKDDPFYEGTEATKLEIDNNGQFSIKLEDGTYESSQSIYIMMGSDLQGTLGYKMEILDEASGNVQFSMDNGNIHFILKMALEMSPITGIAKQDIPVTATLSNIDPLLYGKAATVVIVVSNIGNRNMQFYYKGALLDSENQYNSLVVPIPIEALPNAPKLEIPYTLRVAEEVTAEENLHIYGYVSGFQGKWIAQSVVIGPAEIVYRTVTTSLAHLTTDWTGTQVEDGSTLTMSLSPETGYCCPSFVTITMGDVTLTAGTDYSYDVSIGTISIPNVNGPVQITASADRMRYSITGTLTGLKLTTESETVAHGGTYEGVLSLTDANLTKLPQQITVTTADNAETWTDFTYEPSTGSIIIRNVTEELIVQATAESLTMYSIETELHDMDIEGLPEGDVIQEGQTLRFTLTAHNNYRLPATIQVKSSGEALSTDAYTYDTNTGVVEIPSVQGDITIIASAISEGFHEVVLQLTNLTSDLGTTSFTNGSDVNFHLIPHAGYTLPASLTVTLNGTTLTAGDQYVYDPSTGSFTLSSITGTLSITGVADPKDYGETIFELTHITVGDGHTEKAIHGTIYECQLTADEGYELPNSLQVEMSGVLLNSGYTYENGLLRILSVTGPITITATATIRTYAVFSELENMTSDLTPDLMIAHGDPLTVHLSAADGYSLPRSVSVQINGTDLTEGEGYTYADGVLTIFSVTGPVNISASAILGIEVTETEKALQGSIQAIHVETEGDASLSLNTLETDLLKISSNSNATLSVTADSKIQSLFNAGTLGLTSEGDATLEVQSIYNSGIMELQEGLKLTSTPQLVINDGTFVDNTGMIQKVNGLVVLEIHSPLPPTASCTKGLPFTLTVKVLVASGREKTIFEWQQKANDSWVTVHTDSQEGSLLRSDGLDELTSNYSFTPTESGIYRCIITNSKSEERKTTLMTEISVTVSTPTPDPDPEPDPVPDPDPIPVPDPDPDPVPVPDPNPDPVKLYRVTLPLVEGTAVETYGSTYVRKGKSFSFRINIADGYNAKDMVVKANGTVLLPDATGLYVIEDIQDDVVVTITGIVKESPSAIEGPGYTMTSVWTGQGQIHIQLGKDATVTVSDYAGRIVNTFKGKVGDYHISIQKGSYVVSVDGLTYKVIL